MSFPEALQPPDSDPIAEAKNASPILVAFLSDNSDIEKWHNVGAESMTDAIKLVNSRIDDGWGAIQGNSIVGYAKLDGVFQTERDKDVSLTYMTMQLALVSWQLYDRQELLDDVMPELIVQVASTPYVAKRLANITSPAVTKYVYASLSSGIHLRNEFERRSKSEKSQKESPKTLAVDSGHIFRGSIPKGVTSYFAGMEEWPVYDDNNQIVLQDELITDSPIDDEGDGISGE